MRKILFILASSLLFAFSAVAQAPAPGKGAPAGPPTLGRAFGTVTDTSGKPIEQASVLLLKPSIDPTTKKKKLILFKGMDTKANGQFNFEDLPIVGQLVLRVSASGYKSKDVPFMVMTPAKPAAPAPAGQNNSNPFGNMPSFEKDLGAIALSSDVKELSGVVINATPPPMKLELDKKVFNVEKNITSAGGTAVDVMRNVPSVNVDIDGNVTLRGASPTIFVDGRPTTLTLDEIPADAIESVEVMTNPSAKYDASGGGSGILNIVLKKNRKQGYNGNVSAGIDSHGMPNALASFNIRQGKVNFTATGLYNGVDSKTTGNTYRDTYIGNGSQLWENDLTRTKAHFLFGQVGMDYFVSNRTTLSGSYIKVHGVFDPKETSQIQTDSAVSGTPQSFYSTRYTDNNRWFDVNGAQLGMKHTFAKDGESWTADGSYFGVTSSGTSTYTTDYYTGLPGSAVGYQTVQKTLGTAAPYFWTVQTDYVNPFTAKTKLEAGLRASIQHLENDNSTYDVTNGHDFLDSVSVSNYKSTSQVYAAYATITSAIGPNFGYQLGLRGESSMYSGDVTNKGEHFSHNYPISLFPSIFLSEKLKHNQELQLSATRKINRPSFFQLIPYTDYSDSLNIQRGNPDLVPEFTYNVEFSYMKTFKHNNTLLASIYYKNTQHLITRFQIKDVNPVGDSVLVNTWQNANSAESYGAEVTSTTTVNKWWDFSLNLNVYNAQINTDNLNEASQNALWSWFGKFNSNFKLPYRFTIQLTAAYQSKTNLPVNQNQQQFGPPNSTTQASAQGYIKPFWGMDVAVKRTFFKNDAGSITVNFSDIFRTRWQDQYSISPGLFTQEFDRLKDPQLVRVVFAYRFGKMDLNLFKRKDMNNQGMGDAGSSLQ
ncbi:TonB-dependent receptor [Dinghuibacter silviterrae]|uniref:Outer membrane receptor protein involved in Fe transport n=1 Tax=Dinghuibacter silviterrae TaxID=1539049 RepID=A0A4R8DTN1_9BACT|nr:TonB-dependent receptor [Dinghuibacter silviterrae]TDX01266.1 outer membrane receptor protein involved in Fe transport [Dinghuibacter silviterrae]